MYGIVMAGGSGTRFWPRSRRARPKQLLPIGGDRPLIVRTSERIASLIPAERQLVVTGAEYVDQVREMLPKIPAAQVIGEPEGRDTAPCIGLAARVIERMAPGAVAVAMPSDHVIEPAETFRAALADAATVLEEHDAPVVVFGLTPDHPATGFGYLRPGETLHASASLPLRVLDEFVEKPDAERARVLVDEGCLWNAGLFAFVPSRLAAAYDEHLPGMNAGLDPIVDAWGGPGFEAALGAHFPSLQKVSIDFGVMERLERCLLLPLPVRWDDVGAWSAYERLLDVDDDGNRVEGEAVLQQAHGNIVSAHEGVVAVRGVDDLIVVHTPDATLVCRRDDAQGVKRIVDELERRGLAGYL